MLLQRFGEALDRGGREIAGQHGFERRLVGQRAGDDLGIEIELGIGEDDGKLRARQAAVLVLHALQFAVVGQELHRAVETARAAPGRA